MQQTLLCMNGTQTRAHLKEASIDVGCRCPNDSRAAHCLSNHIKQSNSTAAAVCLCLAIAGCLSGQQPLRTNKRAKNLGKTTVACILSLPIVMLPAHNTSVSTNKAPSTSKVSTPAIGVENAAMLQDIGFTVIIGSRMHLTVNPDAQQYNSLNDHAVMTARSWVDTNASEHQVFTMQTTCCCSDQLRQGAVSILAGQVIWGSKTAGSP